MKRHVSWAMILLGACGRAPVAEQAPAPVTQDAQQESYQKFKPPEIGFQIDTGEFDIQPHTEVYRCGYVELPSADDLDVIRFDSTMLPGSHHMNVFAMHKRDEKFKPGVREDCPFVDFSLMDYVYAAQTPSAKAELPANVAIKFKARTQFVVQMHYINAGDTVRKAGVKINFTGVAPGTITTFANVILTTNLGIKVPPKSTKVVAGSPCIVSKDIRVVGLASHAHKRLVDFTAKFYDGAKATDTVYNTTDWQHPEYTYFTPPMLVKAGQGFTYACTYKNDNDYEVKYGGEADDEMCMLVGYYYPANDGGIYCIDG